MEIPTRLMGAIPLVLVPGSAATDMNSNGRVLISINLQMKIAWAIVFVSCR